MLWLAAKPDTTAVSKPAPAKDERPSSITRVDGRRDRDSDSDYGNEGGKEGDADGWNDDDNWGNMEVGRLIEFNVFYFLEPFF